MILQAAVIGDSSDSTALLMIPQAAVISCLLNVACMTSINYDRSSASIIEMNNGLVLVQPGGVIFFRVPRANG
jgi:hypothetical protein